MLFRSEAFKLIDQLMFTAPGGNIFDSTFGLITSTYSARGPRFALKVQF